jgi:predicted alpha/beta-fold hydrolase
VQFYSASFTGDLRQVIGHILGRYPQSNVYAAGWSLGANILVRYLGEVSSAPSDKQTTIHLLYCHIHAIAVPREVLYLTHIFLW